MTRWRAWNTSAGVSKPPRRNQWVIYQLEIKVGRREAEGGVVSQVEAKNRRTKGQNGAGWAHTVGGAGKDTKKGG